MTIQEYIQKKPLLFDGAMGTYIVEKHPELAGKSCETLNVLYPGIVQEIHEEYMKAGAVAIKTNTFAANEQMQQMDRESVREQIHRGWEIAERAVKEQEGTHFIFADIGPIPVREDADLYAAYQRVVDDFLECEAKCFLFETMESSEALEKISVYIKERVPEAFIIVSFATSPEGYTRAGFWGKKLFWNLQDCEMVDAVGFNCISGPKHLLEMVKGLPVGQLKKRLVIMPNAGYPTMLGNRIYYGANRQYFGQIAYELLQEGTDIIGGCCGTTPRDIKHICERMENMPIVSKTLDKVTEVSDSRETDALKEKRAIDNGKNFFAKKLKAGKKVLVVELDPPIEPDIDFFMEGAARYKYAGVDAIDIADCPIAKARIDSSILACKLSRELGITAIPHMTCRDRNINATKALLLGLNIEGINNVLTVTGDPVPAAMGNQIKTMFSYNSAILARHIQTFNEEVFTKNPFMVSGALNINALNFDSQLRHAKTKLESGVSVLFTQPVLSRRGLENLKRARKELPVKLLGGVMPVVSYRNATFMNNEMAGIEVEDSIIERYRDKNREEGEKLAYEISTHIIDEITDYVDGYYVITPFKRVELILRIVDYIKSLEKNEKNKKSACKIQKTVI